MVGYPTVHQLDSMCVCVYTDTMRVNIYIRKHNEEKWNAIEDKSMWINTLLENVGEMYIEEKELGAKYDKPIEFCKHSAVKGFCKKGCK